MLRLVVAGLGVLFLGVLAGCNNPPGVLGVPGSPAWYATATPQQQAQYFAQICAGYGIPAGTPQMAECAMREAQGTRASGAAVTAAIASRPIYTPPPAPTYQPPVRTQCYQNGNYMNCTTR